METKLRQVKKKCEDLLRLADKRTCDPRAELGWKSTIAAIDGIARTKLLNIDEFGQDSDIGIALALANTADAIIELWAQELQDASIRKSAEVEK